jgi:CheY-like chemotaxis protein
MIGYGGIEQNKRPSFILVVDDDAAVLDSMMGALRAVGYRVRAASTGREALAIAIEEPPGAIVADFNMPGMDGLALVTALRDAGISAPTVMISGAQRNGAFDMLKHEAETLGVVATLLKPFPLAELEGAIQSAFQRTAIHG